MSKTKTNPKALPVAKDPSQTTEQALSRAAVLGHKPALIACILESARITTELLQTAMRAAAHWKDDPDEWHRQCMEVPPHQRADLLEHLQRHYPKS